MEYFLLIASFISGGLSIIWIPIAFYLQHKYDGSLEETIDSMNGVKGSYLHIIGKLLFVILLSIIYIIYYYTK